MADGGIVGAAVKGAITGGASGGGLLSTPFKAIRAGGNAIQGIKRNLTRFHDKQMVKKPVFKKKPTYEDKVKKALGMK